MLTAGTYTVEVTADDCEPLSKEITISADIATHTQELLSILLSAVELSGCEEAGVFFTRFATASFIAFTIASTSACCHG